MCKGNTTSAYTQTLPPLAHDSTESEGTKPVIKGAISECIPSSQAPPPPQLSLLYSKGIEGETRKRQTIFASSEAIVFTYGAITSSSAGLWVTLHVESRSHPWLHSLFPRCTYHRLSMRIASTPLQEGHTNLYWSASQPI